MEIGSANKIFTQVLKKGAKVVFEVELLNDPSIEAFRMDTCNRCQHFNAEDQTCGICGCFMDVKTTHRLSRNLKKMRIETTHCPMGKWNDKDVANHYRQLDGEPLLD